MERLAILIYGIYPRVYMKSKCETCKLLKSARYQLSACQRAHADARFDADREHWLKSISYWNTEIERLESIDPEARVKRDAETKLQQETDFAAEEIGRLLGGNLDVIKHGDNLYVCSSTGYTGHLRAQTVRMIHSMLRDYLDGVPYHSPFMGTSKATYENMIAYYFEHDAVFQMGQVKIHLPEMLPVPVIVQ